MDSWLRIEGLAFGFEGQSVFDGFEVALPSNSSIVSVVGPSGIGKTTLINLLAGYLKPDGGTITLCGEPVEKPSVKRPVVFQDHNLFPWMTTLDNVTFGLRCKGVGRSERKALGMEILKTIGLEDSWSLYPRALSGGMRQRIGLARVLLLEPHCILLDEPFSALDGDAKEVMIAEIQKISHERKIKMLIVTHNLADAVFLSDHVMVLGASGKPALLETQSTECSGGKRYRDSEAIRARIAELEALARMQSAERPAGADRRGRRP